MLKTDEGIKTVVENVEGERKISTRSVTITGDLSVRIPGTDEYQGVESCVVSYGQPMDVVLTGKLAELETGHVEVADGRLQVGADREDKGLKDLYSKESDLRFTTKDPEISLVQQGKTIEINQVMGMPVVKIKTGEVKYTI